MLMQVVKIKHPSEKKDNPVNEVIFFKKSRSPHDLPETLKKDSIHRKVLHILGKNLNFVCERNAYNKIFISTHFCFILMDMSRKCQVL